MDNLADADWLFWLETALSLLMPIYGSYLTVEIVHIIVLLSHLGLLPCLICIGFSCLLLVTDMAQHLCLT